MTIPHTPSRVTPACPSISLTTTGNSARKCLEKLQRVRALQPTLIYIFSQGKTDPSVSDHMWYFLIRYPTNVNQCAGDGLHSLQPYPAWLRHPPKAALKPSAFPDWQQDTVECKGGSVNITQVHGLKDNVMRLPRGDNGDPLKGVELWRRTNKCSAEPDVIEKIDIFTCYRWTGCNSGKDTAICLHKYGHMIPNGWLELALAEVLKAP